MQEEDRPRAGRADAEERQEEAVGERPEMTAGLDVLYRLGAQMPALALAGRPLVDQARRLDALLDHTPGPLTPSSPLSPPRSRARCAPSAGAVVSARIAALPVAPAYVPEQSEARSSAAGERARR